MKDEFPQRKSPRAKWCEYNEGLYFVTVCTRNMKHHFGKIENGAMTLTRTGVFLTHELKNASLHHPHVEILQYVVMPNHFHAIVKISPPCRDAACCVRKYRQYFLFRTTSGRSTLRPYKFTMQDCSN